MVPLGERHLRFAIAKFVEHYHVERNHQGLDSRLLGPLKSILFRGGDLAAAGAHVGFLAFFAAAMVSLAMVT
jgi:hypothetical protein